MKQKTALSSPSPAEVFPKCCANCVAWKPPSLAMQRAADLGVMGATAAGQCRLYPTPVLKPASEWCMQFVEAK